MSLYGNGVCPFAFRFAAAVISTSGLVCASTRKPSVHCKADVENRTGGQPPSQAGRKRARDVLSACEEFNTLKWRMTWASRREDCNAESSCVFIGRSITGACVPRDPSVFKNDEESEQRDTNHGQQQVGLSREDLSREVVLLDETDTPGRRMALQRHNTVRQVGKRMGELKPQLEGKEVEEGEAIEHFRALLEALDVEEDTQELAMAILQEEGVQAVQEFVQNQLAKAAAEELRCQKLATEAYAKDFLLKVLRDPELPGKAGVVLDSVFKNPGLSQGIRNLVYNALGLEQTESHSIHLTRGLVTWLLTGTDWMDIEVAKLLSYIVRQPYTKGALVPLITWTLIEPGIMDPPASRAVINTLPWASTSMDASFLRIALSTLQSDWALEKAKTMAQDYLEVDKGDPKGDECEVDGEPTHSTPGIEVDEVEVGTGDSVELPTPSENIGARSGGVRGGMDSTATSGGGDGQELEG
ncbi:unnamed protein product [Choristocarpus tenellus]